MCLTSVRLMGLMGVRLISVRLLGEVNGAS